MSTQFLQNKHVREYHKVTDPKYSLPSKYVFFPVFYLTFAISIHYWLLHNVTLILMHLTD